MIASRSAYSLHRSDSTTPVLNHGRFNPADMSLNMLGIGSIIEYIGKITGNLFTLDGNRLAEEKYCGRLVQESTENRQNRNATHQRIRHQMAPIHRLDRRHRTGLSTHPLPANVVGLAIDQSLWLRADHIVTTAYPARPNNHGSPCPACLASPGCAALTS